MGVIIEYAWHIKEFKTQENLDKWIKTQGHLYQWHEVFINNSWGVECRELRQVF